MKKFFNKRKNSKNVIPETQHDNHSTVTSNNSIETIGIDMCFNEEKLFSYPYFKEWLIKNCEAKQYIGFKILSNTSRDFLQIKNQFIIDEVKAGINIIKQLEKQMQSNTTLSADDRIKELMEQYFILNEAKETYRCIKHAQIAIDHITNLIIEGRKKYIRELISITTQLLSLLTSIKTIPASYVPVINYIKLSLYIDQHVVIDERINKLNIILANQQFTISTIHTGFQNIANSMKTLEEQKSKYELVLTNYENSQLADSISLKMKVDTSIFHDFVLHPSCVISAPINAYRELPNPDNLKQVALAIRVAFGLSDQKQRLTTALTSNSLASPSCPEILIDGDKMSNDISIDDYIDLVWIGDPLQLLHRIAEVGAERSVEVLKCLSSEWKKLISFVVAFTFDEYLNEEESAAKETLSGLLK